MEKPDQIPNDVWIEAIRLTKNWPGSEPIGELVAVAIFNERSRKRGRPKTITNMREYKARKAREYRAKKREAKPSPIQKQNNHSHNTL